jgi:hypothetical protein
LQWHPLTTEQRPRRDPHFIGLVREIAEPSEEQEPRPFTPELGLLGAILRGALEDVTHTARSYREIRAEAHAWVFGDDLGGHGWNFEQVCTELDLDAERIRRARGMAPAEVGVRLPEASHDVVALQVIERAGHRFGQRKANDRSDQCQEKKS